MPGKYSVKLSMVLNFCSSHLSTHHFKWFIGRFLICKCFLDFSVEFRFYSKFAHWSDNIFLTIPFLHIIASFANDAVIRHLNEAVASTAKIKYALPHWVVLKGPIKSKPSHFYGLDTSINVYMILIASRDDSLKYPSSCSGTRTKLHP